MSTIHLQWTINILWQHGFRYFYYAHFMGGKKTQKPYVVRPWSYCKWQSQVLKFSNVQTPNIILFLLYHICSMLPETIFFFRFYIYVKSYVSFIQVTQTHRLISHCSPMFMQGWVVGKDGEDTCRLHSWLLLMYQIASSLYSWLLKKTSINQSRRVPGFFLTQLVIKGTTLGVAAENYLLRLGENGHRNVVQ